MPKVKRAVAVFDIHYPVHHKPTINALFDYLKENPPDILTLGGDQFHFDCISHHTADKPIYRTQRSYINDVEGFEENVLTPLEKLLPKHCEKTYHLGNHERFETDFIEKHPELDGAIDHTQILNLKKRGWKIIPLGHASNLGKLVVAHGDTVGGVGNQMPGQPAKKALELYSSNILIGHTHAPQTFTKISPVEHTNKWQGHVAPCACEVNPNYLRNRGTAWLNGFCVVDVFPNGNFSYYPVIITDGVFSFGGKQYGKHSR
jgi:predicted MPP superfamily phosphohydrolase